MLPSRVSRILAFAALTSAVAASPAYATGGAGGGHQPGPQPDRHLLGTTAHGADAVRRLGDGLDDAARLNHTRPAALTHLLRSDHTAWLNRSGRVYYQEPAAAVSTADSGTGATPTATAPLADTFALHSDASSTRKIYLNFHALAVSGTAWNTDDKLPARTYAGFDTDGNPGTYSDSELAVVQDVWRRVSELYAPFDVDVTTTDPGTDGLLRTSSTDQAYGQRVLITSESAPAQTLCEGKCVGLALTRTFGEVDATGHNSPVWVFAGALSGDSDLIAQTAGHEVGHTLGLAHDGDAKGEYTSGHQAWRPVMGATTTRTLSQFSDGDYTGATNREDDLAVIGTRLARRPDDAGDTTGTARDLGAHSGYDVNGLISTRADTDVYAVSRSCVSSFQASATGVSSGATADLRLSLLDSSGATVATADPQAWDPSTSVVGTAPGGLDAAVSQGSLGAGTYYLKVEGVGFGIPDTGYSDYGSLGHYRLSVTGCPSTAAADVPGAPQSLSATPAQDTATIRWTPGTAGTSPTTGYVVSVDGHQLPAGTDATSVTVSGLHGGTTYPVSVVARSAAGDSEPAVAQLSVPTWAPTQAPALSVTPALLPGRGHTTSFDWTPPGNPGRAQITGWHLVVTGSPIGTWTPPKGLGADVGGFDLDGLPSGRYTVSVKPTLAAGTAGTPVVAQRSFRIASRPGTPRATAYSGASGGAVTARATWTAPGDNGGAPVNQYHVRAQKLNSAGRVVSTRTATVSGSARSLTMSLSRGRYRLAVQAHNRVGWGAWSARTSAVTAR